MSIALATFAVAEPAHACDWGPFPIHFSRGSATLSRNTRQLLDGYVWAFNKYRWPNAQILVTLEPERGRDRRRNLQLFDQRASAVRKYVVAHGLPAWRVKMAYSETVKAPGLGELGKSIPINGSLDLVEGGCG